MITAILIFFLVVVFALLKCGGLFFEDLDPNRAAQGTPQEQERKRQAYQRWVNSGSPERRGAGRE